MSFSNSKEDFAEDNDGEACRNCIHWKNDMTSIYSDPGICAKDYGRCGMFEAHIHGGTYTYIGKSIRHKNEHCHKYRRLK